MGKRKRRGSKPKSDEAFDSDDERAYSKEAVPDATSDDYFQDDIDKFHSDREKILLDKSGDLEPAESSSEEEEVLGFDSDEDDGIQEYEKRLQRLRSQGIQEEMASDLEDSDDEDVNEDKAWGKARSKFYGADDVSDDDASDLSGSEPDTAALEEQEALAIQKKMAEQLDDQDFALDIFQSTKKVADKKEEKITKDLSKLTSKEKLQLLKKESPEFLELIEEYKQKMTELNDQLLPLQNLIRDGKLPPSSGSLYIETKVRLYLNYCINISFYVMMQAKRMAVRDHPVISRLVQYRNLIKQLEIADKKAKSEMESLLQRIRDGEEILPVERNNIKSAKKTLKRKEKTRLAETDKAPKKKLSDLVTDSEDEDEILENKDHPRSKKGKTNERTRQVETAGEKEALEYYEMLKAGRKSKPSKDREEPMGVDIESGEDEEKEDAGVKDMEDDEAESRRGITYDIAKNKGLTVRKKKEDRNPRVKHRMKYRKAKIRRKGMIREVRKEWDRYGGELSGIRASIRKSTKFR